MQYPICRYKADLQYCIEADEPILNGFLFDVEIGSWGSYFYNRMKQAMIGFHKDEEDDWVARLECGHTQHVRHDPPWQLRPWVTSRKGRKARIGNKLDCLKCERNEPRDFDLPCPE